MLKRLDNVGVAVQEIQRTVAFYTQVLGFEGQAQGHEASLRLGDISLYLFESQAAATPVGRTADYYHNPVGIDHLAFEVEDIEGESAALEAMGVSFLGPIVGNAGEFRYRGFHDPDGNMLYIIQLA
jgi:catechol 2,3-dioxygenase-like lactoylglutathione lyase family enzyme